MGNPMFRRVSRWNEKVNRFQVDISRDSRNTPHSSRSVHHFRLNRRRITPIMSVRSDPRNLITV